MIGLGTPDIGLGTPEIAAPPTADPLLFEVASVADSDGKSISLEELSANGLATRVVERRCCCSIIVLLLHRGEHHDCYNLMPPFQFIRPQNTYKSPALTYYYVCSNFHYTT
jgi:hypothetical protein